MSFIPSKHAKAEILKTLLLVAVLCAAGSILCRAQGAAPSALQTSAQPAGTASPAAEPLKSSSSDEDSMDIYRHAPIVQSIARTIHMPLETTARLFEYINFSVLALVLGIPLFRILPRALHHRRRNLQESLASARKMTDEARTRLAAVEAKLAKLDDEIAQIRSQVEEEAKGDEARIKASIGEESTRIVAAAEQEISAAAAQARRGLRNFAADLALEHASRQLVLTPESDRALIDEFVRDAAGKGRN